MPNTYSDGSFLGLWPMRPARRRFWSYLCAPPTLLYPEKKISYQDIIGKIEKQSKASGIYVLVNVLGDEDNAP